MSGVAAQVDAGSTSIGQPWSSLLLFRYVLSFNKLQELRQIVRVVHARRNLLENQCEAVRGIGFPRRGRGPAKLQRSARAAIQCRAAARFLFPERSEKRRQLCASRIRLPPGCSAKKHPLPSICDSDCPRQTGCSADGRPQDRRPAQLASSSEGEVSVGRTGGPLSLRRHLATVGCELMRYRCSACYRFSLSEP